MMLWAGVASSFLSFAINAYYSERLINYSFGNQFKDILPFIIVSLCLGALTWGITFLSVQVVFQLLIQLVVFVTLTIIYYEWKKNEEYFEIKKIIFSLFRKILRK